MSEEQNAETDTTETGRRRNPRDTPITAARKSHLWAVFGGLGTALTGLVIAITAKVQASSVETKAEKTDTVVDGSYEQIRRYTDEAGPVIKRQARTIIELRLLVEEIAERCLTADERRELIPARLAPPEPPEMPQPLPPTPEAAAAQTPQEKKP